MEGGGTTSGVWRGGSPSPSPTPLPPSLLGGMAVQGRGRAFQGVRRAFRGGAGRPPLDRGSGTGARRGRAPGRTGGRRFRPQARRTGSSPARRARLEPERKLPRGVRSGQIRGPAGGGAPPPPPPSRPRGPGMGRRRRRKRGRPGPPGAPRRRSRSALRALLGPRGAAVPLAQAFQRLGGPSGPPVAVPRELQGVLAVLPASGAPPPPPGASGAPPALSGSARRGLQGALARVLLRAARRGRWEDALPWAGRAHPWEGDGARGFAPPGSLPPHFLLSPPWVQLLRRAGAPRLEALLARCPVFAPTGGRGYLQVGGPPVLERLGSIGGPRLTEPPGPRPAGGKSGAPAPARAAPPADFVPGGVSGGGRSPPPRRGAVPR